MADPGFAYTNKRLNSRSPSPGCPARFWIFGGALLTRSLFVLSLVLINLLPGRDRPDGWHGRDDET